MAMDPSLVISTLALLVSLTTVLLKVVQDQASKRAQLTDILNQIGTLTSSLQQNQSNIQADPGQQGQQAQSGTQAQPGLPVANQLNLGDVAKGGYLMEQIYGLAVQARYLADRIPRLVTEFDLVVIARGFRSASELEVAKDLYLKALAKAKTPVFKIYTHREFGAFAFFAGDEAAGRASYGQALQIPLSNQRLKYNMDVQTLYFLAQAEGSAFHFDQALAVVQRGEVYCQTIADLVLRRTWLLFLTQFRNTLDSYREWAAHSGIISEPAPAPTVPGHAASAD